MSLPITTIPEQLTPNVIHVGFAELSPDFHPDVLAWCLSPDELGRASAMQDPDRYRSYVAAHVLTRRVLAQILCVAAEEVPLLFPPNGAPVTAVPDCHISLSHSGNLVMLALAHDGPIGVDVQRVGGRNDIQTLAQRFFAPAEIELIAKTAIEETSRTFHRLWARKEAVSKAEGTGLLSAHGRLPVLEDVVQGPSGCVWHLADAPSPEAVAVAAVASPRPATEILVYDWGRLLAG
jgi:4'-phosphopantetheinyl transferase